MHQSSGYRAGLPSGELRSRVRVGATYGGAIGLALVAVGVVRVLAALLFGAHLGFSPGRDLLALVVYVAAFTVAGAVAGGLWPLRRTWAGAILVGYLAALIVCAACGLIVLQIAQSHDLRAYLIVVGITTAVFGALAVAFIHDA